MDVDGRLVSAVAITTAAARTPIPPIAWITLSCSPRIAAPSAAAVTASKVMTTAVRLVPILDSAAKVSQNATAVARP